MATKDISRTVIEGGRYNHNKQDRRTSNRLHRASSRRYSKLVGSLIDPDDIGPYPKRRPVRREFKDKLGPVRRWISKQVGKRWDVTFSNLVHDFDTRTVAGNHVVRDHIITNIVKPTDAARWYYLRDGAYGRNEYYLDEDGCLQSVPVFQRNRHPGRRREEIRLWVDERMVMDYGVSLFWMLPEKLEWVSCGRKMNFNSGAAWVVDESCGRKHRFVQGLQRVHEYDATNLPERVREDLIVELDPIGRKSFYRMTERRECLRGIGKYRQGDRFTVQDKLMWDSLTEHEKEKLLHPGSVHRNSK